jgi:hypothetical protein
VVRALLVLVFAALAVVLGAARSDAQEAVRRDPVPGAPEVGLPPLVPVEPPPVRSSLDLVPVPDVLGMLMDQPLPAVLAAPAVAQATIAGATGGPAAPLPLRDTPPPPAPDDTGPADQPTLEPAAIAPPSVLPAVPSTTGPTALRDPRSAADLGRPDGGAPPHPPAPPTPATCVSTAPLTIDHGPWSTSGVVAVPTPVAGAHLAPTEAPATSSADDRSITARGPPRGVVP